MRILVTGGAGYIGSHTVLELLDAGYDVLIADNFVNSKPAGLKRLQTLASRTFDFEEVDLTDAAATDALFARYAIDAVIHFAGLKAVGESVQKPLEYYRNNLTSTLNLLLSMKRHGVERFVFSSSATVYGDPVSVPIREDFALSVTNPYGRTKLMLEALGQWMAREERLGRLDTGGDPLVAAEHFLSLITGHIETKGLLGIGVEMSPTEIERRAKFCADVFMRAFGPQRLLG